MGKAQTIRLATALTIIGIGVPLTVIANSRAGEAGTNLSGTATQLGSTVSGTTGTTSNAAGTSAGTAGTSGSTAASATGTGTNLPADKMTVGGSTTKVSGPNVDVVILQGQMKTSNPADLILSVTSECSIVTNVTTVGNDSQSAMGHIEMWVTIDGKNVGTVPSTPGASDTGHVTFCDQAYSSTTSGFTADPNATIKTGLATEHANAFNWVVMNVGSQVHTIQVHALLSQNNTANGTSQMVIGSRTLVVDTTNTAQNQAQ